MNIIHIIGNYVLIFGKFGAPALGVQGAAISSVGSRFIALLVFFWLLYRALDVKVEFSYYIHLSKEYISKIMKIGVPSAFEQVMYQTCQLIFLFYVTFLGSEAIAARQYANNISMFTYLFAIAVGMGTSIIVGRLVGANDKAEAYKRVWYSVRWSFSITMIMVVLVVLFREPLIGLFTNDPTVIHIATTVLIFGLLLETGRSINIVLVNS